jgi:hypothetical protein
MNSEIAAVAMLVAGMLLGLVVVLRIRSGRSYISKPAMAVTRKEDPFSYWLSIAPPFVVSLFLIAAGLDGLL